MPSPRTSRGVVAAARRLEEPIEEVVEADAVRDDQLGVGERACVVGLGLVVLGPDAGRDDRVDRDPVAADVLDDVGEDGRGGDDPERVVGAGRGGTRSRTRPTAAARGQQDQGQRPAAPRRLRSSLSSSRRHGSSSRAVDRWVRRCDGSASGRPPGRPDTARTARAGGLDRGSRSAGRPRGRRVRRPASSISAARPQREQTTWWWWVGAQADVRVLAARQVEPFDDAQLGEDLERPEDRRPADPEAAAASLAHEVGRREMAVLVGDELGDRATRRRQAVAGASRDTRSGSGSPIAPTIAQSGLSLNKNARTRASVVHARRRTYVVPDGTIGPGLTRRSRPHTLVDDDPYLARQDGVAPTELARPAASEPVGADRAEASPHAELWHRGRRRARLQLPRLRAAPARRHVAVPRLQHPAGLRASRSSEPAASCRSGSSWGSSLAALRCPSRSGSGCRQRPRPGPTRTASSPRATVRPPASRPARPRLPPSPRRHRLPRCARSPSSTSGSPKTAHRSRAPCGPIARTTSPARCAPSAPMSRWARSTSRRLASWPDAAALAASRSAFYDKVTSTSRAALAKSISNKKAYKASGKSMLTVLKKVAKLDTEARALAATAGSELPSRRLRRDRLGLRLTARRSALARSRSAPRTPRRRQRCRPAVASTRCDPSQ